MRHRNKKIHLGRKLGHRRALVKNMAASLLLREEIITTLAKAKIARAHAEKLITLGKIDTVARRRRALAGLVRKQAVKKLFEVLGPRYAGRAGGYTRLRRLGARPGDAAVEVKLSLLV